MTALPKIELKSIKVNKALSQGTACYSATLIIDGKKIAVIGNEGRGGCDRIIQPVKGVTYREANEAYENADAAIKAGPKYVFPSFGEDDDEKREMDNCLEFVCADLIGKFEVEKALKSLLNSKVAYFKDGLPEEGAGAPLYSFKLKVKTDDYRRQIIDHIRSKSPNAYILNEQSFEDALIAYNRV